MQARQRNILNVNYVWQTKGKKAQNIIDILQQIQQKSNNMANFKRRQLSQAFIDKINMFFFRYEYLSFFLNSINVTQMEFLPKKKG